MSSEPDARARHEKSRALFLQARRLAEPRRSEFLAEACGADAALLKELQGLLEHDARPVALAEPSASQMRRELEQLHAQASASSGADAPESIGEFRVLRKLGEGGMGTVYEARQESLQRTVALKVLRPGLVSAKAARRFEHEGELLGRLQHPGIARIYDSGKAQTEFGPQPYFAMELIRGVPLTDYANARGLSVHERLELIARVADAVQHAHRHGVIHRDLKPDNILVDETGQPRVLDFGIARASNSDVQLTTLHTDVGQILGTLAYMSPEQASGDPARIGFSSDVYALGVLLHELLAGRLPYDLSRKNLPEALRIIQEEEPRRLSTTHSILRGDVETIALTALEKDVGRRYASAEALASDIRRFLRHEPIQARPASAIYTLGKFVRRNKTLAVAALLVFFSLSAGLVAALLFGLEEAERRREVMRLSALQQVEDLVARADSAALWPLHPGKVEAYAEFVAEAQQLVAKLPEYRELLEELRAHALPRTPEQAAAERRGHESHARLELVAGRLAASRNVLRQLRDGQAVPLPPLGEQYPEDAWLLNGLAFEYTNPLRRIRGREPLGLSLALRASELATGAQRAEVANTLAWAYLALGRLEDAEAVQVDPDEAPPGRAEFLRGSQMVLERWIAERRAPGWIRRAEEQVQRIERNHAALLDEVDQQRDWRFPEDSSDYRWWHNQVAKLVSELESLQDGLLAEERASPEYGWSIPRRLRTAQHWRAASEPGGEHAERWRTALPAVEQQYGRAIERQVGLVPIGPDPRTGWWEFAHLASGDPATRDADGKLERTEDTGIVLVLVPGGEFWMGASFEPGQRNYHEDATANEGPPHQVRLTPFFISKYEMTQGQWLRLTGDNPSRDRPGGGGRGKAWNAKGLPINLLHPVESVSWTECKQVCWRFGLALPTEAQWEYAARGGTDTAWWTGDDPQALRSAANLADAFAAANARSIGWAGYEAWDDGHMFAARVGSYDPNPFGLHDVVGNVREWCQDTHQARVYLQPYSVDPVADFEGAKLRMTRGGSFAERATYGRSSKREPGTPGTIDFLVGLRPARKLEP